MAAIQKKYKTKLNLKFPVVILEVDLDLDCDEYAKDITSLLNTIQSPERLAFHFAARQMTSNARANS